MLAVIITLCNQPWACPPHRLKFWKLSSIEKKFSYRVEDREDTRSSIPPPRPGFGTLYTASVLQQTLPRPEETPPGGEWAPEPSLSLTGYLTVGQWLDLSEPKFPFFKMEIIIVSACLSHKGGSHDILTPRTSMPILSVHDGPFHRAHQKANNASCSFLSLWTVQKGACFTWSRTHEFVWCPFIPTANACYHGQGGYLGTNISLVSMITLWKRRESTFLSKLLLGARFVQGLGFNSGMVTVSTKLE